jgi:hypothetical protein
MAAPALHGLINPELDQSRAWQGLQQSRVLERTRRVGQQGQSIDLV